LLSNRDSEGLNSLIYNDEMKINLRDLAVGPGGFVSDEFLIALFANVGLSKCLKDIFNSVTDSDAVLKFVCW